MGTPPLVKRVEVGILLPVWTKQEGKERISVRMCMLTKASNTWSNDGENKSDNNNLADSNKCLRWPHKMLGQEEVIDRYSRKRRREENRRSAKHLGVRGGYLTDR